MPSDKHALGQHSSEHGASGGPEEHNNASVLDAIPPPGLVLLAIAAIQIGAGLATHLFPILGAEGTVAIRIIFLTPLAGVDLDTLGIMFALLAGAGWALFIVLAGRVANRVSGNDGLAIGMAIAAITMIPIAAPVVTDLISDPLILLAGFGVALLSTTIPFTLEFDALKRMSKRTYGVLVSVEPAVAALVGALLLGERIGLQGMIAVACVVIAAIGITATDHRKPT